MRWDELAATGQRALRSVLSLHGAGCLRGPAQASSRWQRMARGPAHHACMHVYMGGSYHADSVESVDRNVHIGSNAVAKRLLQRWKLRAMRH